VSEVLCADGDPGVIISEYHNNITWCRNNDVRCGMGLLINDSINFKVREDLYVFIPYVYDWLFIKMENECREK